MGKVTWLGLSKTAQGIAQYKGDPSWKGMAPVTEDGVPVPYSGRTRIRNDYGSPSTVSGSMRSSNAERVGPAMDSAAANAYSLPTAAVGGALGLVAGIYAEPKIPSAWLAGAKEGWKFGKRNAPLVYSTAMTSLLDASKGILPGWADMPLVIPGTVYGAFKYNDPIRGWSELSERHGVGKHVASAQKWIGKKTGLSNIDDFIHDTHDDIVNREMIARHGEGADTPGTKAFSDSLLDRGAIHVGSDLARNLWSAAAFSKLPSITGSAWGRFAPKGVNADIEGGEMSALLGGMAVDAFKGGNQDGDDAVTQEAALHEQAVLSDVYRSFADSPSATALSMMKEKGLFERFPEEARRQMEDSVSLISKVNDEPAFRANVERLIREGDTEILKRKMWRLLLPEDRDRIKAIDLAKAQQYQNQR